MDIRAAREKPWTYTYLRPMTWPFWGVHIAAVAGVAMLGWSWSGFALAAGLYAIRMFLVTGVYHRYFSHRTYKTSRWFQFVLALASETTMQKGVLWWAAHHRRHHKYSDLEGDVHSPVLDGFMWSHLGWIMATETEDTDYGAIKDFSRYPELRWLNAWHWVPGVALAVALFLAGGAHALVWGFFVSTVALWHGTFTINSLSHVFGRRRYATTDDSRNNFVLALITLGEGWHNNHHYYQSSTRQGFKWWEIDITYYTLRALAAVGLVWDLREPPRHIVEERPRREPVPVAAAYDEAA